MSNQCGICTCTDFNPSPLTPKLCLNCHHTSHEQVASAWSMANSTVQGNTTGDNIKKPKWVTKVKPKLPGSSGTTTTTTTGGSTGSIGGGSTSSTTGSTPWKQSGKPNIQPWTPKSSEGITGGNSTIQGNKTKGGSTNSSWVPKTPPARTQNTSFTSTGTSTPSHTSTTTTTTPSTSSPNQGSSPPPRLPPPRRAMPSIKDKDTETQTARTPPKKDTKPSLPPFMLPKPRFSTYLQPNIQDNDVRDTLQMIHALILEDNGDTDHLIHPSLDQKAENERPSMPPPRPPSDDTDNPHSSIIDQGVTPNNVCYVCDCESFLEHKNNPKLCSLCGHTAHPSVMDADLMRRLDAKVNIDNQLEASSKEEQDTGLSSNERMGRALSTRSMSMLRARKPVLSQQAMMRRQMLINTQIEMEMEDSSVNNQSTTTTTETSSSSASSSSSSSSESPSQGPSRNTIDNKLNFLLTNRPPKQYLREKNILKGDTSQTSSKLQQSMMALEKSRLEDSLGNHLRERERKSTLVAKNILVDDQEQRLVDAAEAGDLDCVNQILTDEQRDVNINCKRYGDLMTPLCAACQFGREQVVALLLGFDEGKQAETDGQAQRLDLNQPTKNGSTALHLACQNGNFSIVQLILLYGFQRKGKDRIDVHAVNKEGSNALHLVSKTGNSDIMELLLNMNQFVSGNDAVEPLDVNTPNNRVQTPLHLACELYAQTNDVKHLNAIMTLLQAGANVNQEDGFGIRPLDCLAVTQVRTIHDEMASRESQRMSDGFQNKRSSIATLLSVADTQLIRGQGQVFGAHINMLMDVKALEQAATALETGKQDNRMTIVASGVDFDVELVPYVVRSTVEYLSQDDVIVMSGIHSAQGNKRAVSSLKDMFDRGGTPSLVMLNVGKQEATVVASTLKLFLDSLVEPLIPPDELYDMMVAAAGIPDEAARSMMICKCVRYLPVANYLVLFYLVDFLNYITQYEQQNGFSSMELAELYAPLLIKAPEDITMTTEEKEMAVIAVEIMIREYAVIFALFTQSGQI